MPRQLVRWASRTEFPFAAIELSVTVVAGSFYSAFLAVICSWLTDIHEWIRHQLCCKAAPPPG